MITSKQLNILRCALLVALLAASLSLAPNPPLCFTGRVKLWLVGKGRGGRPVGWVMPSLYEAVVV